MNDIPSPPPGFVIEGQGANGGSNIPPPPPGFQVTTQQPSRSSADGVEWAPPGVLAPIQYRLGPDGKPVGVRPAVPRLLTDAWSAIQAPGKALSGQYDQVEISPSGEVSPFDPRMVEDASSLAGLAAPMSAASRVGAAAGAGAKTATRASFPEIDDLYAAKDAAYAAVDSLGARYSADAVDTLYGDMIRRASKGNISDTRHPKSFSMLVDLQATPRAMTLTQLDQLRQVIRRDLIGGDAAESHFGQEFIRAIDNFIENAGPGQITGVSGETASRAINTARRANTVLRKSETLQDALDNARLRAASSGSGGNIDNAIRQELRKIVTSPKKSMGFTKQELEMMDGIITGGGKLQDVLRLVGKLSPSGNGLMAALGLGATAANPLLAAAPAAGLAAKAVSDRATQGATQKLTQSVRTGGANSAPLPTTPNPMIPKANTTLIEQSSTRPLPPVLPLGNGTYRLST